MAYNDKKYLDISGLTRYDTLIKDYIPITHGYYSNGNFYSDSGLTILITGETKRLYVDLAGAALYEYNGTSFVKLSVDSHGTNAIISSTQPSGQIAGDIWFKTKTV